MVFYCQRNCYASTHRTRVVSCKPASLQLPPEGPVAAAAAPKKAGDAKKQKLRVVECYELLFQDTVLFPEGGGQPDDRGTVRSLSCDVCSPNDTAQLGASPLGGCSLQSSGPLSSAASTADVDGPAAPSTAGPVPHPPARGCPSCSGAVLRVLRRGADAVHYLDKPFPVGEQVLQTVEWERRKDHMQQHSAQHLITAIADNTYGYATTSWSMGATFAPTTSSSSSSSPSSSSTSSSPINPSSIELHTRSLCVEQLAQLEWRVNQAIAAALPVTVREYEPHDPELDQSIRSRGLPADHVGAVRVVSISGVDSNMCCGTHVDNTARLQAVKLLGLEPGKQGKTLVFFVAGDRLIRYLSECHFNLRSLKPLLNTSPDQFAASTQRIQTNLRLAEKTAKEALRDLATSTARLFLLEGDRETSVTSATPTGSINGGTDSNTAGSDCATDSNTAGGDGATGGNTTPQMEGKGSGGVTTAGGEVLSPRVRLWCHHRRLADMDYLSTLVNSCDDEAVLKVLSAGEDRGSGLLLVHGPPRHVAAIAPRICSVLEGKGGGKSRFTAKVTALHKRDQAYRIAEEYIASLQQQQ